MPAPDPVAKLEEILIARGMLREHIPGFIARYAKRPVLDAAQELQQRGIHYEIAYLALMKLQQSDITRESTLDEPLKSSAGLWAVLGLVFFCGGLAALKTGILGPWLFLSLFAIGLLFFATAISKWIG